MVLLGAATEKRNIHKEATEIADRMMEELRVKGRTDWPLGIDRTPNSWWQSTIEEQDNEEEN